MALRTIFKKQTDDENEKIDCDDDSHDRAPECPSGLALKPTGERQTTTKGAEQMHRVMRSSGMPIRIDPFIVLPH
jgi:hypothetical protein